MRRQQNVTGGRKRKKQVCECMGNASINCQKTSDTIRLKWILQKFVRHGFNWRQMALASFREHDN